MDTTPTGPYARGDQLRAGRYELEQEIGRGAAATVWLARDTLLERPVAIKVLAPGLVEDSSWLARFRREARVAAGLQHPNLVSIYDFGAEAERPYLVMAYIPGGSLQEQLDAGGAVDAERLASDLLSALAHIHGAGVIHRDVKPGNVLIDRDGTARLSDFGVARPQDATSITQTGQIPGTARYMAPELWHGEPAGERTDLFAAGVLLGECLPDAAPAELVSLVEWLRAERPESRPASAAAALRRLRESGGGSSTDEATDELGTAPAVPPISPSRTRRRLALAGLGVLAILTAVALADGIGGGGESPEPEPRAERGNGAGSGDRGASRETPSAGQSEADEPEASAAPAADGVTLNNDGYELIQKGRYGAAIPILERAVASLEGSGLIDYAYALFNLGNAYRLAGRPADAIPVLERRLEIPNQLGVVRAELARARADLRGRSGSDG